MPPARRQARRRRLRRRPASRQSRQAGGAKEPRIGRSQLPPPDVVAPSAVPSPSTRSIARPAGSPKIVAGAGSVPPALFLSAQLASSGFLLPKPHFTTDIVANSARTRRRARRSRRAVDTGTSGRTRRRAPIVRTSFARSLWQSRIRSTEPGQLLAALRREHACAPQVATTWVGFVSVRREGGLQRAKVELGSR